MHFANPPWPGLALCDSRLSAPRCFCSCAAESAGRPRAGSLSFARPLRSSLALTRRRRRRRCPIHAQKNPPPYITNPVPTHQLTKKSTPQNTRPVLSRSLLLHFPRLFCPGCLTRSPSQLPSSNLSSLSPLLHFQRPSVLRSSPSILLALHTRQWHYRLLVTDVVTLTTPWPASASPLRTSMSSRPKSILQSRPPWIPLSSITTTLTTITTTTTTPIATITSRCRNSSRPPPSRRRTAGPRRCTRTSLPPPPCR